MGVSTMMKRWLTMFLALMLLTALGAGSAGAAEPAQLVVHAVDSTGQPVAGATVQVAVKPEEMDAPDEEVWAAETSTAGKARLSGLPTGERLWLLVAREGLVPEARSAVLRPGERRRLQVVLGPGGVSSGRAVDEEGRPVAGAEIRLESQAFGRYPEYLPAFVRARAMPRARTDGSGRFQFRDLPQGDLELRIQHPSYLAFSEGSPIQRRPDLGELRLRRGTTLNGRVIDPEGLPVPGIAVWIRPSGSLYFVGEPPAATTGPDGSFSIPNLPPQTHQLHVCGRDTFEASTGVELLDEPIELTLRPAATDTEHWDSDDSPCEQAAERPGTPEDEEEQEESEPAPMLVPLRGRVLGPGGRPIEAAHLHGSHDETWSDASGRFELRTVAGEPAKIDVLKPGFAASAESVNPGKAPVEIRMRAGVTLTGRVLNLIPEDRAPVFVFVSPKADIDNDRLTILRTRPDGTFRMENAPAEPLSIQARTGDREIDTELELVPGNNEVRVEIALPPVFLVSGRILDELGRPIARAYVSAMTRSFDSVSTDSRADGSFTLHLTEGKLRVYASRRGSFDVSQQGEVQVEVAGQPVTGLEIRLPEKGAQP
jgi:protocatechuate 3,4-dioxygenase beta subunit